jgi:hypothetical protein
VSAKTDAPPPEYVPPANTPAAPVVTSSTHPNENEWYKETTARLSWKLPSGITAVRTLLDDAKSSIPTKTYEEALSSRELTDLPQGISYFHIQLKNADGWGRVTHFAIRVDSESPSEFTITETTATSTTNPTRTLLFNIKDVSPIARYSIQIDGGEATEYKDTEQTNTYTLPVLPPGHHTVVVEAFDSAGNSRIASYAFDVESFEAPKFTEYPERLNSGVIPAIKGETRPKSTVEVTVSGTRSEIKTYTVTSDDEGRFTFIPPEKFEIGVYDLTAIATDEFGARSGVSDTIRIIVEEPGYIAIGTFLVSVLSIIIPLIALILVLAFGTWYLYHRLSLWRKKVMKETVEAEEKLKSEFALVFSRLQDYVDELKESRKTKLTRAELALIEGMEKDLKEAESKIKKEITDIEDAVQ